MNVQVRRIRPGWSLTAWREGQYRPFTGENYKALVIDLFKWRIELRRHVSNTGKSPRE